VGGDGGRGEVVRSRVWKLGKTKSPGLEVLAEGVARFNTRKNRGLITVRECVRAMKEETAMRVSEGKLRECSVGRKVCFGTDVEVIPETWKGTPS